MLRLFRRYLKKDALPKERYKEIRECPIKMQGQLFAEAMGLPEELAANRKSQHAVLLLVNSHRVVFRKQLIPSCKSLMKTHIAELWPLFFEIFQDNNYPQRVTFFKEPVVQHLWTRFCSDYRVQFNDYLRGLDRQDIAGGVGNKRTKFISEI